jgi:hypothetical protein
MNQTNNVVQFQAKVTVPSGLLMANKELANLIELAKEQRKMLKAQELAFKILTDQIREAMGENEVVLGLNGEELATYKWIKGSETVDREQLRIHFADVYECVKKIGDATRRLELK